MSKVSGYRSQEAIGENIILHRKMRYFQHCFAMRDIFLCLQIVTCKHFSVDLFVTLCSSHFGLCSLPKARRAAKRGVSVEEQKRKDDAAAKLSMQIAYENRCAARDATQKSTAKGNITDLKKKSKSNASGAVSDKRKRKGVEKQKVKKPKTAGGKTRKSSGTPPAVVKKKTSRVAPPVLNTVNKSTVDGYWPEQANESVINENMEVIMA